MKQVTVIGAGSWGTALAVVLAGQGCATKLWAFEAEVAERIRTHNENTLYLPGIALTGYAGTLTATEHMDQALADAPELVVIAVPSHALRATLGQVRTALPAGAVVLLATKGLEESTHLRVSEVAVEVLGNSLAARLATLSGPTFAREVARGEPAAVIVAAAAAGVAEGVQRNYSSPTLRLYTSDDVTGVELGGALKNVIAIATGICQGMGLGSNSRAALIARGLAEMSRLACAAGGRRETLAGLAGLGDLVLTCTGELSRNRGLGIALGEGQTLAAALGAKASVAEGVRTTAAAVRMAQHYGIEMPIVAEMHAVLFEGRAARVAVANLMNRSLKAE